MTWVALFTFGVLRDHWVQPGVAGSKQRIDASFAAAGRCPGFIMLPPSMIPATDEEVTWPACTGDRVAAQTLSLARP